MFNHAKQIENLLHHNHHKMIHLRQCLMHRLLRPTSTSLKQAFLTTPRSSLRRTAPYSSPQPSTFATSTQPRYNGNPITVTFVEPDGEEYQVEAELGDNFLDVAVDNDIDIEGACGGELACSTCHVVLEQSYFDILEEAEEMDEEEEDMLDLALGLTDTSRLACQVCATAELEGMRLVIPAETSDLR